MILGLRVALSISAGSLVASIAEHAGFIAALVAYFAIDALIDLNT